MKIVFTDLDGTLLDHDSYSYNDSLPGISLLKGGNIPLVLVSSKTYTEMKELSQELDNQNNFIFENGAGIALYKKNEYQTVLLGKPVEELVEIFAEIKKLFLGQAVHLLEMDIQYIQKITGLSSQKAQQAQARLASLPFLIYGEENQLDLKKINEFNNKISDRKVAITQGGRFYHLVSSSVSKGRAIQALLKVYQENNKDNNFFLMGIGDSLNDVSMLKEVDYPFLVRKKDDTFLKTDFPVTVTKNIGPLGFSEAVKIFLNKE